MTFSRRIKEELCRNVYNEDEKKAILSSFLKNAVAINISNNKFDWEIKSKASLTIRFITSLLKELYSIEKDVYVSVGNSKKKDKTYKLEFYGDFQLMEKELCIFENPDKLIKNENQKCAFLVGAFLSGGSVNSPQSSNYHFEICSQNQDLIFSIEKIFNFFNIKSFTIDRKNKHVLYIKKSENISDTLKIMGASSSMFEFEEKRIYRDYSNQMSRLNNLDISNLKKTVIASNEQVKQINYLKDHNLYYLLKEKEKMFCDLRLENEDASLLDMVDLFKFKYGVEVTRTGINHFVRKIKKIYNDNKK